MVEKEKMDDNVVFVGSKPPSVYAFSLKTIFEKGINEVMIKSRGKSITNAVNLVEFMKRTNQVEVKDIKISSVEHEYEDKKDKKIFVSSIEITVTKK